jgi:hypothetical protein
LSQALERQDTCIQELSDYDIGMVGSKCLAFGVRLLIDQELKVAKGGQKDDKLIEWVNQLFAAATSPNKEAITK